MRDLFLKFLIIATFLCFNLQYLCASTYESYGKAVIENDDLKLADKNALYDALIDAIKKHFNIVTVDKSKIPDVNKEFIRFVKSYKIIDRYIKNYTVYYHLLVDVDDITVDDLPLFFKNLKQSVVYYIFDYNNMLDDSIKKIFETNDLTLKNEEDFIFSMSDDPTYDEILNSFVKSDARYLIIFKPKLIESTETSPFMCKTELVTETYSKDKKFKTFKVISNKISSIGVDDCYQNSVYSSIGKAVQFIKKNYITLPNVEIKKENITLTIINFRKFQTIESLLKDLENKRYIENFKMKSFSFNEAIFDVISLLPADKLEKKLKLLKKNYNYNMINFGNGQIILDFSR